MKGIDWLMNDVKAGYSFLFSFSGHGTENEDEDGDEIFGMDQGNSTLNWEYILDDELYEK